MTQSRKENFRGSLIGQCLGDALGAPVEGQAHADCQRYVDEMLRTARWDADDARFDSMGQYTDDSQLARELMQSCVACKGFDPQDYAGRIAAIFAEGRIFRPGRATSAAASRLIQGVISNGIIQPLYTGGRCYLMPPQSFLQWPVRWLQAISRYQATVSGGPQFRL